MQLRSLHVRLSTRMVTCALPSCLDVQTLLGCKVMLSLFASGTGARPLMAMHWCSFSCRAGSSKSEGSYEGLGELAFNVCAFGDICLALPY